MGVATGRRESLSAADWSEAALVALARGGLAAVAVEPLAKELGATKGSFYWHFADRNELLVSTLELWELRDTERVIGTIGETGDVATRLRTLLHGAFASVPVGSEGSVGRVELALQASASHPLVAPVLSRVTQRRLAFLTRLYTELGLSPARAWETVPRKRPRSAPTRPRPPSSRARSPMSPRAAGPSMRRGAFRPPLGRPDPSALQPRRPKMAGS